MMMPVRSKRAKIPLPTATGGRPQPTLLATPRAGKGGIHAALPPRGPLDEKNDLEHELSRICVESMCCDLGAASCAGLDRPSRRALNRREATSARGRSFLYGMIDLLR